MFSNFPRSILSAMGKEDLSFHAHHWVVDIGTYEKSKSLSEFFNILATDSFNETTFVVAVEAKNYAISGVMFHPET
jgi:anthranilate/para-aminobenzoate synthase component II